MDLHELLQYMPIELQLNPNVDEYDFSSKALINSRELQYRVISEWMTNINEDAMLLPSVAEEFGRKIYAGRLRLTAFQGRGYVFRNYGHYFDCGNSIVMSDGESDSLHAASCCVGFDIVPNDTDQFPVKPVEYARLSHEVQPGDVIISQLQSTPNLVNKRYFNGWRWEQMMVTLTADLMKFAQLKNLYIWPGDLLAVGNSADPNTMMAFKRRYNGTARALGFSKNTSGLYVLTSF